MIRPMARKRWLHIHVEDVAELLAPGLIPLDDGHGPRFGLGLLDAGGRGAGRQTGHGLFFGLDQLPSLPARSACVNVAMASTAHLLVAILDTGELARSGISTPAKMNCGIRITGIKRRSLVGAAGRRRDEQAQQRAGHGGHQQDQNELRPLADGHGRDSRW